MFTGGTISMRHDAAAGGNVPTHGGEALLALAPEVASVAPCRVEDWARMPACHLTQSDMWRLRERVRALLDDPEVAGIVITHGTDVLEETAYLLDRTLAPRVPVVVTGAMRTSDHAEWDGTRNLTDAVRVAASPASVGRGTLVAFAGQVWQGIEATKRDTVALDAFAAPFAAPLGEVDAAGVRYLRESPAREPLAPAALERRVALVPMVVGDAGEVLDLVRPTHDGVVIEAFGSGNLPPGAVPAIGRWLAEGKPVVLSSRCPEGVVTPVYGFDGGGARTVAMGVVPAGPRTPSQARWELTVALSAGTAYAAGLPEGAPA
ncbi:MAG TPA: asparaginase [Gemmatimonadales bacterium]|nr:asparaginase [Gemmatimonadales bacterium]